MEYIAIIKHIFEVLIFVYFYLCYKFYPVIRNNYTIDNIITYCTSIQFRIILFVYFFHVLFAVLMWYTYMTSSSLTLYSPNYETNKEKFVFNVVEDGTRSILEMYKHFGNHDNCIKFAIYDIQNDLE